MDVNLWTGFAFVNRYTGMTWMGGTVWTGSASVNEICKFELAILLRDVNLLTWCFTCKMFARLWMRHTHENEVCTCEPVNRLRSCLRNAHLWMECTCVNGTGETYTCVRICKTRAHLWMEMRICEGKLCWTLIFTLRIFHTCELFARILHSVWRICTNSSQILNAFVTYVWRIRSILVL